MTDATDLATRHLDAPALANRKSGLRDRWRLPLVAGLLAMLCTGAAPASEPIPLQAGPLTLVFEPDQAFIRHKIGRAHV